MKWIELVTNEDGVVAFDASKIYGVKKRPVYRTTEDYDRDNPYNVLAWVYVAGAKRIALNDTYDAAIEKIETGNGQQEIK